MEGPVTSKPLLATLLGLALAGPSSAFALGLEGAPPATASFRLGALAVTALRDGTYVSANDGGDFGSNVGPWAVGKLLAAAGASEDDITLSVGALLVRMPGHVVLLDTGSGAYGHGALQQSLRLAGVAPDAVTDVLITHSHIDHAGGLVGADGKLAFPRATIWMSAREWASMRGGQASKLVAAIAPQVKTFEPGRAILPGITPVALYGHTVGHVGYEIVSQGQRLEDIGDAAHSVIVSLERPAWWGWIDEAPQAARATRLAELRRLAARHELVFAPHFPFPGVGWVVAKGDGYEWKPDTNLD
jgi:glyoxylase-like metal-dependent hydrolase (beta-lactamase superfamily II)